VVSCAPRARAGCSRHTISLVFGVLLTANFLTTISVAKDRQMSVQHDEQLSKVDSLLANGECKKVWSIFWPRFVKHDIIALREFSKLSSKYYFQLPGQSGDQLSILRRIFIFSVFGFDPVDAESRDGTLSFIDGLPTILSSASSLHACFAGAKTTADTTVCQSDAQASHMIPKYKDFLSELRRDSQSSGNFVCVLLADQFTKSHK
jgi:hypothetical protein